MIAEVIAEKLLSIRAVSLSPYKPYTWASGIKSPIYCDNRKTLAYPEIRSLIIDGFVELAKEIAHFDVIAGVATAGIPHGALLADRLGKPFAYVRSKPKDHGMKNLIEGEIPAGSKVLVIEDLISTGGSSIQAVEAVREAGGTVAGVLAIFTYGFPEALQAFAKAHCILHTITDYSTLLDIAVQKDYITADVFASLQEWRENPREWQPNAE